MRLWRISSLRRARDFSGGYGRLYSGRWNTPPRPVTYCSTVPSLAALEKRVHVTDPALLPPQALVEYELPDDLERTALDFNSLTNDWTAREIETQRVGDRWIDAGTEVLLFVPSVVMPIVHTSERNVLINHLHRRTVEIKIANVVPFTFDPRLFQP